MIHKVKSLHQLHYILLAFLSKVTTAFVAIWINHFPLMNKFRWKHAAIKIRDSVNTKHSKTKLYLHIYSEELSTINHHYLNLTKYVLIMNNYNVQKHNQDIKAEL